MSRPGTDDVRDQAADWVVRLDAPGGRAREGAALDRWLSADVVHREAFEEAMRTWRLLDRGLAPGPQRAGEPRASGRRARRGALIAAALLLAVSVALGAGFGWELRARLTADAWTAPGEARLITLPDGSRLHLNTASAVTVRYRPDVREIGLRAGEAAFEVVPDARRPFRVAVGDGTATALGTRFQVRVTSGGAAVTVLEGRVRVAAGGEVADLDGAQRVSFKIGGGGPGPIEAVDAEAASAWRRGRIVFVDRPLGEVVDELNRYHRGRIQLAGSELATRRVSGAFRTSSPMEAAVAIQRSLGLHGFRFGGLLVVLMK